jgi:hypothetical protein
MNVLQSTQRFLIDVYYVVGTARGSDIDEMRGWGISPHEAEYKLCQDIELQLTTPTACRGGLQLVSG